MVARIPADLSKEFLAETIESLIFLLYSCFMSWQGGNSVLFLPYIGKGC